MNRRKIIENNDNKKKYLYIVALSVLVFLGCCIWGYKVGYDRGLQDGESEIVEWINTHDKYRKIIEKIWKDVDPKTKQKYE